jgi:hypothetical protein
MAKDELVKAEAGALESTARPSWMEQTTGSQDITSDDIRLPRLAIAQGLSPQMIPDKSEYIPDLRMFDMFNDVTSEIYGRGPLKFVPVYWHVKNIEFEKDDKGKNTGIIVDDNVPSGDPRTKWSKDPQLGKMPPRATRYTEMVVYLVRPELPPETIIISIKETNRYMRRAAQTISGALVEIPRPYYGGVYTVKTMPEKFDEGTAGVFVFGIRPTLWNQDRELYERGKMLQESLKGKTIVVNRDVSEDAEGDTSFDTDKM